MTLDSYGTRVGIRTNDPTLLDEVIGRLPPGWKAPKGPIVDRLYSIIRGDAKDEHRQVRRLHLAYANELRLARASDLDDVMNAFESDVQLYVAEMAHSRVFLHAGVVGWRGRAIVIPGPSFSGKTTLVAALAKRGATYYSDEYAVLDGRGRVHPFPRPLSIRHGQGEPPSRCRVETLGGVVGVQPLPMSLVLITRYKPGARWVPQRLSAGQASLALFANTVAARRQPRLAFATLSHALSHALVLKGVRGDAEAIAGAVLNKADAIDANDRERRQATAERRA